MGEENPKIESRLGVIVAGLLLATITCVGLVDVLGGPVVSLDPSFAVALAAVACASLTTTGVLALRSADDAGVAAILSSSAGIVLVGLGAIEIVVRIASESTNRPLILVLATGAWLGRGLVTVGLAFYDRGVDKVVATSAAAATVLGVVGTLGRGTDALPSDLERLGAGLLAATLVLISLRWLRRSDPRPHLYGSVAFLACGLGLAFVFGTSVMVSGDTREIASLVWLVLASALSGAWLDRRSASVRRERDRVAFEAMREAEHRRVTLESVELQHHVLRHDSRSSLTAIEGGVQALLTLHERGDHERVNHMIAVLLAELGRTRRLLEGVPADDHCVLGVVLEPLVALHRASGLRIDLDLDSDATVLAIPADHLAETLQNLLANCATHAPGAPVAIVGRLAIGGERLLLTVADDGPGISAARSGDAFDPYRTSGRGQGLGLHAVRTLLEASNATVSIEPRFRGAALVLDLPVAVCATSTSTPVDLDLTNPPVASDDR